MDEIWNSYDWSPWLQEIWKALMGKIIFNGCHFIWVKFYGQVFIKIGILQLIYYNYNDFERPYKSKKYCFEQLNH